MKAVVAKGDTYNVYDLAVSLKVLTDEMCIRDRDDTVCAIQRGLFPGRRPEVPCRAEDAVDICRRTGVDVYKRQDLRQGARGMSHLPMQRRILRWLPSRNACNCLLLSRLGTERIC